MTIEEMLPETTPDIPVTGTEITDPAQGIEPVIEDPDQASTGDEVTEPPAAEEVPDPFAAFGGQEAVTAGHQLYEAVQTEDGQIRLFLELGRNMGLGLREMEALVSGSGEAEADPTEPEDLDRPMTLKEFRDNMAQQEQRFMEQRREQQIGIARGVVQETFAGLGVDPQDPSAQIILALGDKHLTDPNDLSPEKVRAAVMQGHADFQVLVQKQAAAYVAKKAAKNAGIPKSPSGVAAPAAPAGEEPKNTAEAIAQVRAMFRT